LPPSANQITFIPTTQGRKEKRGERGRGERKRNKVVEACTASDDEFDESHRGNAIPYSYLQRKKEEGKERKGKEKEGVGKEK